MKYFQMLTVAVLIGSFALSASATVLEAAPAEPTVQTGDYVVKEKSSVKKERVRHSTEHAQGQHRQEKNKSWAPAPANTMDTETTAATR